MDRIETAGEGSAARRSASGRIGAAARQPILGRRPLSAISARRILVERSGATWMAATAAALQLRPQWSCASQARRRGERHTRA